jgi:hypothetical protein
VGLVAFGVACRQLPPHNIDMAKDKKSFILYCDLIHEVDHLTDEEKGRLFQHLLEYVNDLDPVLDDRVLLGSWKHIQRQLKRDLQKYEEIKQKRVESGRKGGKQTQANASKPKQAEANQAVTGTGTGTGTGTVTDILLEKETKELFNDWIAFRKEIKKPIKTDTAKISLAKKIQSEGLKRSREVIKHSMDNEYQGLFWDKVTPSKKSNGVITDFSDMDYFNIKGT